MAGRPAQAMRPTGGSDMQNRPHRLPTWIRIRPHGPSVGDNAYPVDNRGIEVAKTSGIKPLGAMGDNRQTAGISCYR